MSCHKLKKELVLFGIVCARYYVIVSITPWILKVDLDTLLNVFSIYGMCEVSYCYSIMAKWAKSVCEIEV